MGNFAMNEHLEPAFFKRKLHQPVQADVLNKQQEWSEIAELMLAPCKSVFECQDERKQKYIVTIRDWYDRDLPTCLHIQRVGGEPFNRQYSIVQDLPESELILTASKLAACISDLQYPLRFRSAIRILNQISRTTKQFTVKNFSAASSEFEADYIPENFKERSTSLFGRPGQERAWAQQLSLVNAAEISIGAAILCPSQCLLLLSNRLDLKKDELNIDQLSLAQEQGELRCILINPNGVQASRLAKLLYGQFMCLIQRQPQSMLIIEAENITAALAA